MVFLEFRFIVLVLVVKKEGFVEVKEKLLFKEVISNRKEILRKIFRGNERSTIRISSGINR